MSLNLPPGITKNMIPGNLPEDQEVRITLILSISEIDDIKCELENQKNREPEKRSPIWYVLENIVEQLGT